MSQITKNIYSKFSTEAEITFTLTELALTIKQIDSFLTVIFFCVNGKLNMFNE